MVTQRSSGPSTRSRVGPETATHHCAARFSSTRALSKLAAFAALGLAVTLSNIVYAGHLSWVQQSSTYDVWLGVVSASDAGRDQELTRMHRTAEHGKYPTTVMTRHVMVSVFKRPTNERVINAEIVAELVENDLIHLINTKKRLELMPIYGMSSFCNYFDLHWNGKYRIEISIREPGSASEKVSFLQEVTDLPK